MPRRNGKRPSRAARRRKVQARRRAQQLEGTKRVARPKLDPTSDSERTTDAWRRIVERP